MMRPNSCVFALSASLLVLFAACGGGSNNNNNSNPNPVPGITALSPASVTAGAAAQTLTLTGTNFLSSSTVTYNAVAHTATFVSATELTIPLSASDQATAGTYAVVVTNPSPGGGASNSVNLTVNNPTPTVTTLSPSSANAGAAAETLTINGANFVSNSTVTYNAASHTATYVSATQLTIQLSAGDQATSGTFAVVVTNPTPGGGASNSVNFTVDNPVPTLASLSPASAAAGAAAQTLTINGTNFTSASTVTYNSVAHTAKFVSATQLTVQLSAADQATGGTFVVVVTNPAPGGGASNSVNFTVDNPAPTIASLSPTSATAGAAAQTLTVNGANFVSTSIVTYNGVAHTATLVSSIQLTIMLSASDQATAGTFPVVVTNPAPGGGASNAVNFTVSSANNPVPVISSLSPASANAGAAAQTLTITGIGFISASTVTYNGAAHTAAFVSSTQLTIMLSASDQATAGTYPVVVTNPAPGGGASNSVNFTVNSVTNNPVPVISSLSPSSATAGAAAQTLTIAGTGFIAASTVTYNSVSHTATFVSSTQLTITLSASDQATAGSYPVVVTNPSPGGGASNAVDFTVSAAVNNVLSLDVNLGPNNDYVNGLFASVEVCEPGSTTNCTTVPNVIVDTGSSGLRLLSGAVSELTLPAVTDSSGDAVQECISFISLAYIWGPVVQGDIHLSGESASSASIHIISESPQYPAPLSCLTTMGAQDLNSVAVLGANGILGVAATPQDCGSGCADASNGYPTYFSCPNGNCQITSVPTTSTQGQVWNPVALFPQDDNGVLISLQSVAPGGAVTDPGSLIFGIGTQSNNALGTAQVYAVTPDQFFTTTYNGAQYTESFIDSGSNAYFFLDSATLGNLDCADLVGWYCPTPGPLNFTVTNTDINGNSGSLTFSIANADSLFSSGYAALNDLGGDSGDSPSTDYFDFGMPFFFGRNVFVGIAGQTVTGVTNAPNGFWAY
jgi:hypothetical protein